MADIKTRNVVNGTIRTIDKASVASQRMKTSYAKTKQQAVESYSSDDNLVEYASGRMSETASRVLHKSSDGAATAGHQGAKAAQAAAVNLRKNAGEKQLKKSVYKGNVRDLTLRENGRAALARSRARAKARHDAEKKVTAKATKNVLKKVVISFARAVRTAGEAIKASAAAIAAAGSTAVIIIIVCVLFCTVFCVFEDSSGGIQVYSEEELLSFEEGAGIGSTDIVKVAGTQIGNWNGRKFWSWYGDGSRDHVGIVESCDGRYVHTIEGNSSNLCRRKTYPVGWYEIYGYGVPKYPGPNDKKSEKKAESEKTDKK